MKGRHFETFTSKFMCHPWGLMLSPSSACEMDVIAIRYQWDSYWHYLGTQVDQNFILVKVFGHNCVRNTLWNLLQTLHAKTEPRFTGSLRPYALRLLCKIIRVVNTTTNKFYQQSDDTPARFTCQACHGLLSSSPTTYYQMYIFTNPPFFGLLPEIVD